MRTDNEFDLRMRHLVYAAFLLNYKSSRVGRFLAETRVHPEDENKCQGLRAPIFAVHAPRANTLQQTGVAGCCDGCLKQHFHRCIVKQKQQILMHLMQQDKRTDLT